MAIKNNKQDEAKSFTIDMPDVSDIPGQEHVHPPRMREIEDTTISSADEEGEGLLDELNGDEEPLTDGASNLGAQEKVALSGTARTQGDDTSDIKRSTIDQTDGDDPLNENSDPLDFGEDLDVPGSELDDTDEEIGEEDEENNSWSV